MWFGVVLHCWVGLSWVPIVGPADPILRVPPSKNFFWHSTEIGSCCFPFGFLIYAGTVVLPVSSSSLRSLHSLPSRAPVDCNGAKAMAPSSCKLLGTETYKMPVTKRRGG